MTDSRLDNLFEHLPSPREDGEEAVEEILRRQDVRLERIVSHGQASAEGFWYDQDEDEWVLVLEGQAELRFEDPDEWVTLRAGDHLLIHAHRRHRVESTTSPTVWLALWIPSSVSEP